MFLCAAPHESVEKKFLTTLAQKTLQREHDAVVKANAPPPAAGGVGGVVASPNPYERKFGVLQQQQQQQQLQQQARRGVEVCVCVRVCIYVCVVCA